MDRIVITGGAGYIGTIITEVLLERQYKVTCIDNFYFGLDPVRSFLNNPNYSTVKKDIRKLVPSDLDGFKYVVDLAGLSNDPACDLEPTLTKTVNHMGSVNVSRCAREAGVQKYILASSCSVYGAGANIVMTEVSPLRPVSLYAEAKIAAEHDIEGLGCDDYSVTFLRFATVFGLSPRMRFDLVVNIMTLNAVMQRVINVHGDGRQWRPLVHVRDVADSVLKVIEAPKSLINKQAFNVGSTEQNYRVAEIAKSITRHIPDCKTILCPPATDIPDKRSYKVAFEKATQVLGYRTNYSIDYGIEEVLSWITKSRIDFSDPKFYTVEYYKRIFSESSRTLNDSSNDP